jgi:SAM-dependent methyltransferase
VGREFADGATERCGNVEPLIVDYFDPLTLLGFLRKRHPYDFALTYEALRDLFEYRLYYVNLGFWSTGGDQTEPGREMVFRLADLMLLHPYERLVDVGSGLGQGAIDLVTQLHLSSVRGININPRQVAFANALARATGLDDRIQHVRGDAGSDLPSLVAQTYDAVMAVECVGHFADPLGFLDGARKILRRGGRLGMCLNIRKGRLSFAQKALYYAAFGCVPTSLECWLERLRVSGLKTISVADWTNDVLRIGLERTLARARLATARSHPLVSRYVALQLSMALRSVKNGGLGYCAICAEV